MKDYRIMPHAPKALVILLHGVGANGQDLISLGQMWAPQLPQVAFVSPDAPQPFDMGPFGRQWFSLYDYSPAIMEAEIGKTHPILNNYIESLLKEFAVPASRCALVGFSQGTMMSLYTGLRFQTPLAGVLGYSGALFGAEKLPDVKADAAPRIALVHGSEDNVVPVEASRLAASVLGTKGYTVDLHLRPGLGHSIDDEGLALGAAFLKKIFA